MPARLRTALATFVGRVVNRRSAPDGFVERFQAKHGVPWGHDRAVRLPYTKRTAHESMDTDEPSRALTFPCKGNPHVDPPGRETALCARPTRFASGGVTVKGSRQCGVSRKSSAFAALSRDWRASHSYGLTTGAPSSVNGLEHAGTARAAFNACAISGKIPRREFVTVATDQHRTTHMAVGGLAPGIVNVSSVHVANARLRRDASRPSERLRGRRRRVQHLPIRVECREVQRHVGAEAIDNPGTLRFDFGRRVVLTGNEQGGNFEPDVRSVFEVFKRFKHGSEPARA